ncbi:hypothetical protein BATR1942_01535 [Bacillus atrophaeus 1942]|uniref:Uncharacterized protein n=1 Tax=Bacillus atrophaeus (strain 1942) TaxID=720555 RepID=A0ABM5LU04_BACA1|nr:hypothetical protein BATR1942_01535 [Bacillus atrophaeus 1942]
MSLVERYTKQNKISAKQQTDRFISGILVHKVKFFIL